MITEEWVHSKVDGSASGSTATANKKKQATAKKPSTSVRAGATVAAPISFNIESYFNAKREEIDVFLVGNSKKNKTRFLRFMGGTYSTLWKGKISKPRNGDMVEANEFESIEEAKAHVTAKVLDALENKGYDLSTSPDAGLDSSSESESEDEDTKFNKQMGEHNARASSAEKKGHGAYIKFQREHLGITTAAMAKKLKTTKRTIERLESGAEPSASDAILEEVDNQFSTIFALRKEKGWK